MSDSKKKLLVVDDEESIHLLYKEEFEDEGYEVYSAMSGEEALKLFDEIKPDLVVLDINMPGIDGIEVLRQLKQKSPSTPVIISSAYPEYKQDLASWASDDYIVKSFDLTDLKESIKRHLKK